MPSSPTSSAPSVTQVAPSVTQSPSVPSSLPSVIPSLLPSSLPSVIPSSLPSASVIPSSLPSASVIPSSLPSVYVCKDVTDEVAFTRKNKDWSCTKLGFQYNKKIKKICKDIVDAQRQCAITCNSCFSNSPSLATLSPSDVCKDAGDEYTFNYKSEEYTCKILQGESVGKIEKVCWKKQLAQKYCPLTCDVCTPVIIK